MNFNNFEKEISRDMLAKGESYFLEGAVSDLSQEGVHWYATVLGSDEYEVTVEDNLSITDWDCDCPYDHGPICKHVVAVFYAIRESKEQSAVSKPTKKADPVEEIFKKAAPEELLLFFRTKLRSYKGLKQELLAEFANLLNAADPNRYNDLVETIIKNTAMDRYGNLDFRAARQLSAALDRLYEQAELAFHQKKYADAFGIASAVLTKVPKTLDYIDDSNGILQDSCRDAIHMINELYTAPGIAADLKDRVFQFVLDHFEKDKADYDTRDDLMKDLLQQTWGIAQLQKVEQVIKRATANLKGDYSHYAKERYIHMLIEIAGQLGDEKKKEKLIADNLSFPNIRKIKLEQLLEEEAYELAKELIADGIAIAKENGHPGTVRTWEEELLSISRLQKDVDTERELLHKAFFSEGFHRMKYYQPLKSTYSPEEWPAVREDLIKTLGQRKGYCGRVNNLAIADIYVEDQLWDRLLLLLQNTDQSVSTVQDYGRHLHHLYPAEMLALYKPGLILVAQHASSRPHYRDLASDLKKLLKIKGGRELVIELLGLFRQQYAKRPAMMDELGRVL